MTLWVFSIPILRFIVLTHSFYEVCVSKELIESEKSHREYEYTGFMANNIQYGNEYFGMDRKQIQT